MAVQDYKINYKSDFVLNINGDAGWAIPFCIKFWTGMPSQAYFVGFDGVKYVNCKVGDTPTQLLVVFDDHHLPIGKLKMQIAYHTTIAEFPGSVFDEVTNARDVIVTIDGTDYQVMLDFTGEDVPELEFDLPAYANEAERIQNELQRQQNEAARIEAELEREQASAAAVAGAENVNAQLSGNILTVTNRNGVSTSVNTKGEQGEQGPVGPEGPQGEQGETGISIVSFTPKSETSTTLIYTVTFSDGHTQDVAIPKGAKGDTGATGPQGPQGDTGVSITGFVETSETETATLYNITFSNGTTQQVAIPKGEKGDTGEQGPVGPQGPQGPMGDVAVITPEQQAAFTMYSVPGQNTDGPMTQKAVTDNLVAGSISYDNSQSGLASTNVQGAFDEVGKEVFVGGISEPLGSAIAYVINSVGNWTGSASTHYIINANAGDKFKVSANASSNCTCVWLRQASTPSQGGNAYVSNVDNKRYVVEAGGQIIVTAPSDAVQLYIQGTHSGIDHTPSNVSSMYSIKYIVIGDSIVNIPSTLTNEVILSSDYPTITSSQFYKLTGYIPVNEGDVINVPNITAYESSVVISGYSEQSQSSNIESLKIKGNGAANYNYIFTVPKGVNYIRIGGHNNSANTTKEYTLYSSSNKSIYAQQIRDEEINGRQEKQLLNLDAVSPYETLYSSIRPRKGCVMFQMDCNQYFFANAPAYTELLKNYGVNYCTLLCLNNTFGTYVNTIKDLQSDGHEIAIHGTGVHSGNYEDTLKSYFTDFANNGILWDGYVELSTEITPAELLIAKKYFSWIIKNGGDYSALNNDYINAVQTINEPPTELKRIGIELNHNQATQSNFSTMIANVKDAIDSVVENGNVLVIYGHTYAQVQNTNYTVYNEVLEPILAYLKGYIDSKRVIVGRTTPLLNYFYTKRFNE